jgi:hypothetical protein
VTPLREGAYRKECSGRTRGGLFLLRLRGEELPESRQPAQPGKRRLHGRLLPETRRRSSLSAWRGRPLSAAQQASRYRPRLFSGSSASSCVSACPAWSIFPQLQRINTDFASGQASWKKPSPRGAAFSIAGGFRVREQCTHFLNPSFTQSLILSFTQHHLLPFRDQEHPALAARKPTPEARAFLGTAMGSMGQGTAARSLFLQDPPPAPRPGGYTAAP